MSYNSSISIGGSTYTGMCIYPDGYNGNKVGGEGVTTWAAINEAGIVFLPCAGRRFDNGRIDKANINFWSSTPDKSNAANANLIQGYANNTFTSAQRYCGCSVRLVYNAN